MPRNLNESDLLAIETVLLAHPQGAGIETIERQLRPKLPRRTLQYRLKALLAQGRLTQAGKNRWAKYHALVPDSGHRHSMRPEQFSKAAAHVLEYVRRPLTGRKPVSYDRHFLQGYRPNVSAYLSQRELNHLKTVGALVPQKQPAGTYARHILNRLLIDLSWNSSRLEGNTYSLLDTQRLIEFEQGARGRTPLEAQMILNHRDAIEFLVGSASDIGFNRYTILNLHALLSNNLLANPNAIGALRHIPVGIGQSAFHPLGDPHVIEECFDQLLRTASAIHNPFEQSLFMLAQLPCLQPFEDANKRVSRLASNIPLIIHNLVPLSFSDVSTGLYTEAMLGVYELRKTSVLKEVFLWAYERSALRYTAVKQSLGEPDAFRFQHRDALRTVVAEIVRQRLNRHSAFAHIKTWAAQNVTTSQRNRFREMVEQEMVSLHEGNFARYALKPSEFKAWESVWNKTNSKSATRPTPKRTTKKGR